MLNRRGVLATIFGGVVSLLVKGRSWAKGLGADPIVRVQSWPFGTEPVGEWWACELPRSKSTEYYQEIAARFGVAHTKVLGEATTAFRTWRERNNDQINAGGNLGSSKEYVACGFAGNSPHEDKPDVPANEFLEKAATYYNKKFCVHPVRNVLVRTDYFTDPDEAAWIDAWDVAHTARTVHLKEQLAAICKWGA